MKYVVTLAAATAMLAFSVADASAQSRGHVRAQGPNGMVGAGASQNGAYVRGRGSVNNSDGSVTYGSGGAIAGVNGGGGVRGSTTNVNPDGSVSRNSVAAAAGVNGGVSTQGSTNRNSDGTWSGSRNTQAVGAQGSTYQGSTTYDQETGLSRSGTCTNPSGVVVPCY